MTNTNGWELADELAQWAKIEFLMQSIDQPLQYDLADNIEQGLAKLVLSLIELLRQLLERQAIRRMEGGSVNDEQIEKMGEALMKLEAKIHELATHFGLSPADLNLDLGPLGNLLET